MHVNFITDRQIKFVVIFNRILNKIYFYLKGELAITVGGRSLSVLELTSKSQPV